MRLPSLRKWRIERGISQVELASIVGVTQGYLTKIDSGERGCSRKLGEKLAGALGVELAELQGPSPPMEVSKARAVSGDGLHRAYLKRLLDREAGSSYLSTPDLQLEWGCAKLSWEGVIAVVSSREREAKVLEGELADESLTPKLRGFYEGVLEGVPDEDIRLLASARRREKTERGREELTKAMRRLV